MSRAALLVARARAVERFDPSQPRDDHGRWTMLGEAIALLRKGGHDKAARHLEEAQTVVRRPKAERHARYRHDVIDAARIRTEADRLDEQHSARLFPGSRMEDPENRRLNRAQAAQRRAELAPLESRITAHEHFFGTEPDSEDHVGTAQTHVDALQTDTGGRISREEAGRRMFGDAGYEARTSKAVTKVAAAKRAAPAKAAKKAVPKAAFSVEGVHAKLDAAQTREEGHAALEGLSVAQLREVSPSAAGVAKTKAALAGKIVDQHVGARLQGDALRALGPASDKPLSPRAHSASPSAMALFRQAGGDPVTYHANNALKGADVALRRGDPPAEVAANLREQAATLKREPLTEDAMMDRVGRSPAERRDVRNAEAAQLLKVADQVDAQTAAASPPKLDFSAAADTMDTVLADAYSSARSPAPSRAVAKVTAARKAAPAKKAVYTPPLDQLRSLPSREDAHAALQGLSKAQLVSMAQELFISGASGRNMADLREQIVEGTAGRRLDSEAIRSLKPVRS